MFYCLISVFFFNSIALQTHYFAFIFVRFRTRKFILPSKVEAVVIVVDVEVEINFIPLNQQGGIYTSLLLSRNCNHRVSLAWTVG